MKIRRPIFMKDAIAFFTALMIAATSNAASIKIELPADTHAEKAIAATEKLPKTTLAGTIDRNTVTFKDPLPGMNYEVQLTLKDGTVLQGVDMEWYSLVPDKKNAEELSDDDRQQMNDVLKKVLSFYNINDAVLTQGNHNRAVMLVQLARDKAFHSDKGDEEVIWRPELWYFENHHGGWEKVPQTDRVLRRERFATHKEYHTVLDVLKWVPELGGLKSTPAKPDARVKLPFNAGVYTASPRGIPSSKPAADDPQPKAN